MNKAETIAHMLAFAAPFGGFDLSNKERKRSRKFACTECGKDIPPGKPGRKCKGCRDKVLRAPLRYAEVYAHERGDKGSCLPLLRAINDAPTTRDLHDSLGDFEGIEMRTLAALDESSPLKKLTPHEWCKEHRVVHIPAPPTPDGEEPQDPLAIVYEKSAQMGHSDQIAQQIIAASERDSHKGTIVIDERTILCDLCNQADTPACNECDYRGLKEQRDEQQVDN